MKRTLLYMNILEYVPPINDQCASVGVIGDRPSLLIANNKGAGFNIILPSAHTYGESVTFDIYGITSADTTLSKLSVRGTRMTTGIDQTGSTIGPFVETLDFDTTALTIFHKTISILAASLNYPQSYDPFYFEVYNSGVQDLNILNILVSDGI